MTHVNIDRHPDAVKNSFAMLALTAEGSLVEVNGRAVALTTPAKATIVDSGWTPQSNHRRCDLVDKKFAGGLTPVEEDELGELTVGLRRFVDRVAPVPLDEVRKLHPQLLEKAPPAY